MALQLPLVTLSLKEARLLVDDRPALEVEGASCGLQAGRPAGGTREPRPELAGGLETPRASHPLGQGRCPAALLLGGEAGARDQPVGRGSFQGKAIEQGCSNWEALDGLSHCLAPSLCVAAFVWLATVVVSVIVSVLSLSLFLFLSLSLFGCLVLSTCNVCTSI